MTDISSNNKRIARNTAFLYVRMFFVLGVALYTSRVILDILGVEDYGIYNVVAGFVGLLGFLNYTLSASMQRFYNYELGKNGDSGISHVYTAGLRIHIVIALIILIVLESIGLWYINRIMVIPPERLAAANFVFQAAVLSMVLVILQIPYVGSILAYERMDFYSIMSILDVLLKLGIVLILPYFHYDKLIVYAILISFITVFDFACYFVYAKRTSNGLRLEKQTGKGILKEMLSFSGWNLVGTFAFELKGQGLNMVLNLFFGPIVNAARGISFQIQSAINGFSSNIVTAFRPQMVDSYAKGDKKRVLQLFYSESKICFALMLILSIPLILETNYILRIWLGNNIPDNTNIFAILVLFDMLVSIFNYPVVQLAFATGDIKNFQIANSIVNLLLLPASYLLLHIGLPATSVFVATIVFSVINQTVCVYELNKLYSIGIRKYLYEIIISSIAIMVLSFIVPFSIHIFYAEGFLRFFLVGLADVILTPALIYLILLNPQEKAFARNFISSKLMKQLKVIE